MITCISHMALVTSDLVAATAFFVEAFDAELRGEQALDESAGALMGLPDTRVVGARLAIGAQEIHLLSFDPSGRPYPSASTSSDLWFQHFAIIVSDMAAAYAQLQKAGRFMPISEGGPQTLPPGSGSVKAFKFRSAEGHPLELLEFPPDGGPDIWRKARDTRLFLGIDHSAIAVADTKASVAFFERGLGLRLATQTENRGAEQSRMDAIAEALVTVSGLTPRSIPPHVELLGYQLGSRRPIADATRSNDIAATQFVMETENLAAVVAALAALDAHFVSPGIVTLADGRPAIMILDPDGHRFVVVETRAS